MYPIRLHIVAVCVGVGDNIDLTHLALFKEMVTFYRCPG